MSAPHLGQPVTFTHSLHRWSSHDGQPGHGKSWVPMRARVLKLGAEQLDGIVVGVRTLANGRVVYPVGDDGPDGFRPTEHFTAYLVAYDVRRKPVYVLPEHCTLTPTHDHTERATP